LNDDDTDGSCADKDENSADIPSPADREKDSNAKSKAAPKEAPKKVEAKPETTKDEKGEPGKRNMLDPRNWFRKKEKPAEEAPKKDAPAAPKENSTAGKKPHEAPSSTARSESPSVKPPIPETRPQGLPIEKFADVWKRDDRDKIFQQSINRLNALKLQAHPLYRPLIGEYIAALRLLESGRQKGVAEKLAGLHEERAKIHERARGVESHLDWYEASQTKSYSGIFDDYLKLCEKLDRESRSRNDAISKYLDLMQKEYD
jgi:hypothetical protein